LSSWTRELERDPASSLRSERPADLAENAVKTRTQNLARSLHRLPSLLERLAATPRERFSDRFFDVMNK